MAIKRAIAVGVAVVAVIVASSAVYTVDETEQAVVFQLGQAVRAELDAGLKFKLPFVQNVEYYERRILNVDPPAEQVNLLDQRRLNVDAFTRYRIVDPLAFFQSVRDEANMAANLSRITNSALRDVLGTVTQADLLSEARGPIMERIRDLVAANTTRFGIEVLDVRIVRADVPETTVQSVFDRMRSERQREAAEARAQGEELSAQIRSRADRDRTVLLAEAEREAETLRGIGDAESIAILAQAYGADPAFYAFYRSMEAYREAMADESTMLVLSPTSEFFRFFSDPGGGSASLLGTGAGNGIGLNGPVGVQPPAGAEDLPSFEGMGLQLPEGDDLTPALEALDIEVPPTAAPPTSIPDDVPEEGPPAPTPEGDAGSVDAPGTTPATEPLPSEAAEDPVPAEDVTPAP